MRRPSFWFYYGFDPDTDRKALYIWNYRDKRVFRKLFSNPFAEKYKNPFLYPEMPKIIFIGDTREKMLKDITEELEKESNDANTKSSRRN